MGRDARSGSSLNWRDSTRMASKPAQLYWLAPSLPPHSMRSARPWRIRAAPSTMASVPVLQALELEVTWLPRASRPLTRAEIPLPITCSTMVEPRRRTLPASVMRHQLLAHGVQAAHAGAQHRARFPVDVVIRRVRALEAGVDPRVHRRDGAVAVVAVHRHEKVRVEVLLRDRVGALRALPRRCSRT